MRTSRWETGKSHKTFGPGVGENRIGRHDRGPSSRTGKVKRLKELCAHRHIEVGRSMDRRSSHSTSGAEGRAAHAVATTAFVLVPDHRDGRSARTTSLMQPPQRVGWVPPILVDFC